MSQDKLNENYEKFKISHWSLLLIQIVSNNKKKSAIFLTGHIKNAHYVYKLVSHIRVLHYQNIACQNHTLSVNSLQNFVN